MKKMMITWVGHELSGNVTILRDQSSLSFIFLAILFFTAKKSCLQYFFNKKDKLTIINCARSFTQNCRYKSKKVKEKENSFF